MDIIMPKLAGTGSLPGMPIAGKCCLSGSAACREELLVGILVGKMQLADHETFMRRAIERAADAAKAGEVPVGAVVVLEGRVIGEGYNQPITTHDPTAHAEIVALRAAAKAAGNYRLTGATMYVTVEPCLMCVGAMVHARIGLVVYGALEPKAGALQSMTNAHELGGLNHRLAIIGGVMEQESRELLQAFFKERR
jgi:tRNA(adenine34) deaminase